MEHTQGRLGVPSASSSAIKWPFFAAKSYSAKMTDKCLAAQINSKITKETSPLHFFFLSFFLPVPGIIAIWLLAYLSTRFLTHALAQYRSVNKNSYASEHSRATGRFVTGFRAPFSSVQIISIPLFFPFTIPKGQ